MITVDDKSGYMLVSFLQDALATALAGKVPLAILRAADGTTLAHELRSGQPIPRHLALDFSPLLDVLHLPRLGDQGRSAQGIAQILQGFADPLGELKRLFDAPTPAAIFARLTDFFTGRDELKTVASLLGSFVEGQFGIALSLLTTFKNLTDPRFPRAVIDALLEYFFAADGFVTVDGLEVAPPMQGADAAGGIKGFADKNGERYLRDLIGVTVEAAGDVQYQLRDRYPRMLAALNPSQQETARRWFRGFATMAEAGVTAAVEETLLGIGSFQGNRLIAAAASAYAGTAARKATQHVFVSEMNF
jgi:hypothetical protein